MDEYNHEFDCCICGRHFSGIYGNNPWPVYEKKECCDECNKSIIYEARHLRLDRRMEQIPHFTVIGKTQLYQDETLKKGMKFRLIKDSEFGQYKNVIRVDHKKLGTVGYIANSPGTVIGNTKSAEELYDQIDNRTVGRLILATAKGLICAIEPDYRFLQNIFDAGKKRCRSNVIE